MKLINFFAFITALFVVLINAQAGNFKATCRNAHWTWKGRELALEAHCTDRYGAGRVSFVELNKCLINDQGHLGFRKWGSFQYTCARDGWVLENGSIFRGGCLQNGRWRDTSIDLNEDIKNDNGYLKCRWES